MDAGGIGPPPSRCKREGLPLAYASLLTKLKNSVLLSFWFYLLLYIPHKIFNGSLLNSIRGKRGDDILSNLRSTCTSRRNNL